MSLVQLTHKINFNSVMIIIITLGFLFFLPFFLPPAVATEILIYGLFAVAFNILLGYTGMLSFGHAAYFGVGAYTAGLMLRYLNASVWTALLGSIVLSTVVGLMIGFLGVQRKGVYFAMFSAAFANIFYFLALSPLKDITGGEDGLKEIPMLALKYPFKLVLSEPIPLYYFIYVLFGISILIILRIIESPFGRVLQGIRENEERMQACGYNTRNVKIVAVALSSLFSGLAGGMYAIYLDYVPLTTLHWLTSGKVVMMALLGGTGTYIGPLIGAGIFLFLENTISIFTPRWEVFVGSLVVIIVLFSPSGFVGTIKEKIIVRTPRKKHDHIAQSKIR